MTPLDQLLEEIAGLMDSVGDVLGKGGIPTTVVTSAESETRTFAGQALAAVLQLDVGDSFAPGRRVVVQPRRTRHFLVLEFIPGEDGTAYTMTVDRQAPRRICECEDGDCLACQLDRQGRP